MSSALAIPYGLIRRLFLSGMAVVVAGTCVQAQTAAPSTNDGWQRYDWLKSADEQRQAAAAGSVTTTSTQDTKDPFTVLTTGSLWQDKTATIYTRHLEDSLTLSYESSSTLLNESSNPVLPLAGGSPDGMNRTQKAGLQFQPVSPLTLGGNVHTSTADAGMPGDSIVTTGVGFNTETHFPSNSVLVMGMNSDRTATDSGNSAVTTYTACDAQLTQPLGSLPFSAQLKGHFEEIQTTGTPLGKMPSLEQSLTWKKEDTTMQMGLRQQQYQEYPGIDNQFNAAIFADLSQKLVSNVTWHSYGELLNTRGLVDQAPLSPIASGANGTQQATGPGDNINPASSVPLSLQDQTLTLSTGPSFQLQKDLSASFEYSNRWDKNPAPGNVGQEQRVSLSVKGSF